MSPSRLKLRVKPGARVSGIVGWRGDALKVAVAAAPERGKANRAVVALLAEALGVPPHAIAVVAGEASPDKVVEVAMSEGDLYGRLPQRP